MNTFGQKEVLFKHTDKLSEAIDKSQPNWQENIIYFVEDNINKKGTIFLNGIPYAPTGESMSELVGYSFQNVATGNYVTNIPHSYSKGSSTNFTLLTSPIASDTEIITFSNKNDFAGVTTNPRMNNVQISSGNYFNSNSYTGDEGLEFHFCLSGSAMIYYCIRAVDNYGDTDYIADTYYLWKHNATGCGVLCERTDGKRSYLDLQISGNGGQQPFEIEDNGFIWSVPMEERKQYQWVIKPVYRTKSQWTPRGTYSQQESYVAGDVVSYNNSLYLCLLNYDASNVPFLNPDETTAKSYWAEVFKAEKSSYRGEYKYEYGGIYNVNDVVVIGTNIYMCTDTYTMDNESSSNPAMKVHWAEILKFPTPKDCLQYRGEYTIGELNNPSSFNKNDIVEYDGTQYICVKNYTTPSEAFEGGGKFIPTINNLAWVKSSGDSRPYILVYEPRGYKNKSYEVGDIVSYNNSLYECIQRYSPVRHPTTPLDTTYWRLVTNINRYLSEEDAKNLTETDIINMENQVVLYKDITDPIDARGLEKCNLYRCTGVASELSNPYENPFNSIMYGLPYWRMFAITSATTRIKVTYFELAKLRYDGLLDTRMEYILTDYNKDLTSETNAHHNFYIILTAADNHTLNKKCSFMVDPEHADYFKYCSLDQWTGEYILNNDNTVHIPGCNGTIVYMIDEFNNECNFDFKNALDSGQYYAFTYVKTYRGRLEGLFDSTVPNEIVSNKIQNNLCLTYGSSRITLYTNDSIVENNTFILSKKDLGLENDNTESIIGNNPTIHSNACPLSNVRISQLDRIKMQITHTSGVGLDADGPTVSNVNIDHVKLAKYPSTENHNIVLINGNDRKTFEYNEEYTGYADLHRYILSDVNINNVILSPSTRLVVDRGHTTIVNSNITIEGPQMTAVRNNVSNSELFMYNSLTLTMGDMILDCDIVESMIKFDLKYHNDFNPDLNTPNLINMSLSSKNSKLHKYAVSPKTPDPLSLIFNFNFNNATDNKIIDLKFKCDQCTIHNDMNIYCDNIAGTDKISYCYDQSINLLYDTLPDVQINLPDSGLVVIPRDTVHVYLYYDGSTGVLKQRSNYWSNVSEKDLDIVKLNDYIPIGTTALGILNTFYNNWRDSYEGKYLLIGDNIVDYENIPESQLYELGVKIDPSDSSMYRDEFESYNIMGNHDSDQLEPNVSRLYIGTSITSFEEPRLNHYTSYRFITKNDSGRGGGTCYDYYINIYDIINALPSLYKVDKYKNCLKTKKMVSGVITMEKVMDDAIWRFFNSIQSTTQTLSSFSSYNISTIKNGKLVPLKEACNNVIKAHNNLKIACAEKIGETYKLCENPLEINFIP